MNCTPYVRQYDIMSNIWGDLLCQKELGLVCRVRMKKYRSYKGELLYLQEFQSMEHFKRELIEYLDYYNNRRIKAKLKGLPPAIHRQQALSVA